MAKTSDFDLLISLQEELRATLEERKRGGDWGHWVPKSCCKSKIRRLRLQLQEVMSRIENKCNGYKYGKEGWE